MPLSKRRVIRLMAVGHRRTVYEELTDRFDVRPGLVALRRKSRQIALAGLQGIQEAVTPG